MDKVTKGLAWYTLGELPFTIVLEIMQIGQVVKITLIIAGVATILLAPCIALAILVLKRKH